MQEQKDPGMPAEDAALCQEEPARRTYRVTVRARVETTVVVMAADAQEASREAHHLIPALDPGCFVPTEGTLELTTINVQPDE